jgi:hypothetical protein
MFTRQYNRPQQRHQRYERRKPFNQPETSSASQEAQAQSGYMAQLEAWLDEAVFEPIERAIIANDTKELHLAFAETKRQLKRKVLESYHNGMKAKTEGNNDNAARRN